MLSIAIPVYNYYIDPLVSSLVRLVAQLDEQIEIIVMDDDSEHQYQLANRLTDAYEPVRYIDSVSNLGRAAIRNRLVEYAQYDWLLFLDCDSGIVSDNFLQAYIKQINSSSTIIAGGRIYSSDDRIDPKLKLHWTYGHKKESRALSIRSKYPYRYFHSNNFLIKKELIVQYPFDERIGGYGYEDLVLAKTFQKNNLSIQHIDNPVCHLELHDAEEFLEKTSSAVQNLINLNNRGIYLDTSLENCSSLVQKLGLRKVIQKIYSWRKDDILANLRSTDPKLYNLDLYKLNHYLSRSFAPKKV